MNHISSSSYDVYFEHQAQLELKKLTSRNYYSSYFVLVDENTKQCCLEQFEALTSTSFSYICIEISSGEEHKNIDSCKQVWHILTENNADRKSLLINLGGGVLTDLGGFCAATYKRGIDFVNIPTTLLSMVDAAVGGKTGIDFQGLKNHIGVFCNARMTLVMSSFLETLDQRQINNGMAEMIKHGLIYDEPHFYEVIKDLNAFRKLIARSVYVKHRVVTEDPKEGGLRKILNFGHTLGHAIETYMMEERNKETLFHGEAIGIGMILEAYISFKLNKLLERDLKLITKSIIPLYDKVIFKAEDIKEILKLSLHDKKNKKGKVMFVLLEGIGKASYDIEVEKDFILEAFDYYQKV
tara:strand:+ start:2766 stop:3824 length:1059 start_codon:yes stop_codon:yes gene_type:complete